MNMRSVLYLLLLISSLTSNCLLDSVSSAEPASEPFSLHPENHRYFLFRGKPTVLVTSAEHYGLLLNRAFDFETYFDELASHGLNHTRVFSGAYREIESSFGITNNPLAPGDENYLCPWKRTAETHRDGSPIFDLTVWDEDYFKRLHRLVKDASHHGIVIEMCLFSPMYRPNLWDVNPMNIRNNVNSVGDCGSKDVYTGKLEGLLNVQKALAEKMVAELLPYDNVYIEICNEPYFGGVTNEWQNEIIDAVAAKQKELGCQKLISINVANKTKKIESPHPAVSIFNFHYCHPPIVVAENKDVKGVIGENETGFRGAEDFLYRTEGWDFLLAGGATYNNLDYSFSVQHPDGTQTGYKSPGGGSVALRKQLGILKREFDKLPLPEIQAQPADFIQAGTGLVASAIGKPGMEYLAYVHVELPSRLKDQPAKDFTKPIKEAKVELNLPAGRYRIGEIDTKNGKRVTRSTVEASGDKPVTIDLATFSTDVALVIKRTEQ